MALAGADRLDNEAWLGALMQMDHYADLRMIRQALTGIK